MKDNDPEKENLKNHAKTELDKTIKSGKLISDIVGMHVAGALLIFMGTELLGSSLEAKSLFNIIINWMCTILLTPIILTLYLGLMKNASLSSYWYLNSKFYSKRIFNKFPNLYFSTIGGINGSFSFYIIFKLHEMK